MRGFICLTAHPTGCEQNIKNQIAYVKSKGHIEGAKRVLVILEAKPKPVEAPITKTLFAPSICPLDFT